MRIHLWKGYHGPQVRELVAQAWSSDDDLLVLCPPGLEIFGGFRFLPEGEVVINGEWTNTPEVTRAREPWSGPEKPVLGLFTTGTSAGETRLILYSKKCIRASLNGILNFFDVSRIDSIFCYPQPFHTFGLLLGYILALEKGWPLTAPEGKYSSHFHEARARLKSPGLLTLGTPTHFQDLMAQGLELAPSYSCIIGGASVTRELWRRLQTELHIESPSIGYGNTEASPGVAHLPAGQAPLEDNEVGLPLPGLGLRLKPGQGYEFSGESVCLAIASASRLEFPKQIFIADELHRRADGVLVFDGRNDLVLNRGGEKFSLEAIERCLKNKLALETLSFCVPDSRLGFELGLLVRGPFESQRVLSALQAEFAVRFDAAHFAQVAQFPTNSHQKLDRRAAVSALVDIKTESGLDQSR